MHRGVDLATAVHRRRDACATRVIAICSARVPAGDEPDRLEVIQYSEFCKRLTWYPSVVPIHRRRWPGSFGLSEKGPGARRTRPPSKLGAADQADLRGRPAGVPVVRRRNEGHRVHHRARRGRHDPEASRAQAGAGGTGAAELKRPPGARCGSVLTAMRGRERRERRGRFGDRKGVHRRQWGRRPRGRRHEASSRGNRPAVDRPGGGVHGPGGVVRSKVK